MRRACVSLIDFRSLNIVFLSTVSYLIMQIQAILYPSSFLITLTFTQVQLEQCGNVVSIDCIHGQKVIVLSRVEHPLQLLNIRMAPRDTICCKDNIQKANWVRSSKGIWYKSK